MVTKRRPLRTPPSNGGSSTSSTSNMNFRAGFQETSRAEAKGTRPTATPSSIKEILLMAIIHICKKTIFFDTDIKVAIYLGSLFLISLLGDFVPFPKSYFSRSDNLFNVYFVKMGWAWTLFFTVPYLFMTSYTICCGNTQKFLKHHLPRIGIATMFWFIWTKLFNVIESSYGRCTIRNFDSKPNCLKAGHLWHGFDISGHAFILIYSSLILIEEARPIVNWESIKEHIRNELYNRSMQDSTSSTNPLRYLTNDEMKELKFLYEKFTPAIRTLFIGMTFLQLLWDIMLVCTMLYYHNMAEKVVSGIFAILTWFFTYRAWYPSKSFLPDSAGKGNFNYQNIVFKQTSVPNARRRQSLSPIRRNQGQQQQSANIQIPRFMGMPLYTNTRAAQAAQAAGQTAPTPTGFGTDINNFSQPNDFT